MESNVIYQDEHCIVAYGPKGVVDGHVKIFPKKPAKRLSDLPIKDAVYLFEMAGKIASILFDGLGAHGTNIICNDGVLDKSLCVNVIPRFQGDNLKLEWQPKPGDRAKLDNIEKELKPQMQYITVEVNDNPTLNNDSSDKENLENVDNFDSIESDNPIEKSNKAINMLLRQINRLP